MWNNTPNQIKNCFLNVFLKKLKTSILDSYLSSVSFAVLKKTISARMFQKFILK